MSPNSFHDIVPPERRSIRSIAPSRARASKPYEGEEAEPTLTQPRPPRRRRSRLRFGILFILILILVGATAGFSLLFAGSKVVVTPKQKDVAIEGEFEAYLNSSDDSILGYQVMTHTKSISKAVTASGEAYVEEPASGTIIIYNNYSSAEQRLVKNTRFQSDSGLIYRIADSVTVPGQSVQGEETVPGSIEAVVYADQPGEEYNIGLTDFTIPGFEGDPRYESFYARSKTPMQGGFVGNRPSVDEATLASVTEELEGVLAAELRAEASAQAPEGFYLFEEMSFVEFEPISVHSGENGVEATLSGTFHGILFAQDEFARFIAQQTVAGYDGEPVSIESIDTISVAPVSGEGNPWEAEVLPFNAAGTARLVWTFSDSALREDLAGRDKQALPTVLSGYPSIEQAEVVLRPFWRRSFPESPDEISVELELLE